MSRGRGWGEMPTGPPAWSGGVPVGDERAGVRARLPPRAAVASQVPTRLNVREGGRGGGREGGGGPSVCSKKDTQGLSQQRSGAWRKQRRVVGRGCQTGGGRRVDMPPHPLAQVRPPRGARPQTNAPPSLPPPRPLACVGDGGRVTAVGVPSMQGTGAAAQVGRRSHSPGYARVCMTRPPPCRRWKSRGGGEGGWGR